MLKGLMLISILFTQVSFADEIIECVSPNGKKVYTNKPCAKGQESWTIVTQKTSIVDGFKNNKNMVSKRPLTIERQANRPRAKQNTIKKMESFECKNAKRAWHFENDYPTSKNFNRQRIMNDVIKNCGGWPSDLEM